MILLNLWLKKTISYSVFSSFSALSFDDDENCYGEKEMTPLALQHPHFLGFRPIPKQHKKKKKKYVIAVLAFYLFHSS